MQGEKTILIVGGTGGIGSAVTELYVKRGWRVFTTYAKEKSKQKLQLLKERLGNCVLIQCDICCEKDISRVIEEIEKRSGVLDVLINTAANTLTLKPFEQTTLTTFKEDINTTVFGAIKFSKLVLPLMKKSSQATIIHFLTAALFAPPIRMSSYIIAKYGLLGLVKTLAVELEQTSIRVIGISPSFVDTEFLKVFPSKLLDLERTKRSDKQFLQPEDIAQLLFVIVQNTEHFKSGENVVIREKKDIISILDDIGYGEKGST